MRQRTIEETYQKKTPLEHILLRPDTYVGSIEEEKSQKWVLAQDRLKFEYREIRFVPALYKIFDEILVNAADNYHRGQKMTHLIVEINEKEGFISVENNGKGIPVEIHREEKVYVPEMIFGHLLTGSNYNDDEKKVVGGRNGYGAKLANIFSLKFIVECGDHAQKKKFKMVWRDNMRYHTEPEITTFKEKDFTKVTFYPDFQRFGMKQLESDIAAFLKKRVFDMAGIMPKVRAILNGNKIDINSFMDYIDMYYDQGSEIPKIRDKDVDNERWQIVVSLSDSDFRQVSFVNSICTTKGGTHVNYITDQIVKKIQEKIARKDKSLNVKPFQIKTHLWIFVNCLIENPAFDSQTKETLTLKTSKFGSECQLSKKMISDILKTGIVDTIFNEAKVKELNKLAKQTAGTKKARILDIPKLEDANQAGTKNSGRCTLILTEGDSAKGTAMSGLEVIGRDYYGVFPLKGKLLNAREASTDKLKKNAEVCNILKIVGLQFNKSYDNLNSLRYGSIMIMTDQDTDGSHIKGLIVNMIQFFWPDLFKIPGFLKQFITPIIKVTHRSQVRAFYTLQDYKVWSQTVDNIKLWKIKYYKGLGTSTDAEAKSYFENLDKHMIRFAYEDEEDDKAVEMAFSKKQQEQRKEWLGQYKQEEGMVYDRDVVRYKEFIDRELIHFSNYDNVRSICSMIDGFKPGQRKILYSCFKRNLKDEIKVAQLAGYVSQHSAYHHGEMSLTETIVGMAQGFVGSNNINTLMPNGQFGSRHEGGKEHASARYIFTCLNKVTRFIFPEPDDHTLEYAEDDGQLVQPTYYMPIIPMVLVNGCQGIGTGWSTHIPNFNPRQIANMILTKLNGEGEFRELVPWYKGNVGEIVATDLTHYSTTGLLEVDRQNSIMYIKELPVGKWISDYKSFLNDLMKEDQISRITGFREYHTKSKVNFELDLDEEYMQTHDDASLYKVFKLEGRIAITNMVAFNRQRRIVKYPDTLTILNDFQVVRLEFYIKRKEYMVSKLFRDRTLLEMKERFISEVIDDSLIISRRKKLAICEDLKKRNYIPESELPIIKTTKLHKVSGKNKKQQSENGSNSEGENNDRSPAPKLARQYNYLLSLPLYSLTEEKVEELRQQFKEKTEELEDLEATDIKELWRRDIIEFLKQLDAVEDEEEKQRIADDKKSKKSNKTNKVKGKAKPKPKKELIKKEKLKWESSDDEGKGDAQKVKSKVEKKRKRKIKADDLEVEVGYAAQEIQGGKNNQYEMVKVRRLRKKTVAETDPESEQSRGGDQEFDM